MKKQNIEQKYLNRYIMDDNDDIVNGTKNGFFLFFLSFFVVVTLYMMGHGNTNIIIIFLFGNKKIKNKNS